MVIYALVEASTSEEALAAGRAAFDRLVGATYNDGAVFDYYVTFDDETSSVAGPARWGSLPVVAPVESDAGQALVDRGWAATVAEFQRQLDRVRHALDEYSDEAIMCDEGLVRHAFYQVGAYDGPSIFIYDQHGAGVRHRGQLDRLLDEYDSPWVVPADVHF